MHSRHRTRVARGWVALSDFRDRLREAVKVHYSTVRGRFGALLSDASTADDLAQEVFVRLCSTMERVPEVRNVGGLIKAISQNVFRQYLDDKQAILPLQEGSGSCAPSPCPLAQVEQQDASVQIRDLLNALDPEDQWLVVGRHFFELSGEELAASVGLNRRTAVYRYSRAMEKLRQMAAERGLAL